MGGAFPQCPQFHTHQLGWRTSWVYNIGGASCSLQMPAYSALNFCKDCAGFNVSIRGLVRSSHGSDFGLPWLLDARVLWWLTDSKQPEYGMLCGAMQAQRTQCPPETTSESFWRLIFTEAVSKRKPGNQRYMAMWISPFMCIHTHIYRYIYIHIYTKLYTWLFHEKTQPPSRIYNKGFPN